MLRIGLFVINFQVLVTVLAKGVLHTGPQGYGYLMTALGCGALVGAGIMATRHGSTPGLTPLVVAALIVGGLGLLSALLLLLWWQRSRNQGQGLPNPGPTQVTG